MRLNNILLNGDIGLHGDNHDVFQFQQYDQQYQRLKSARSILEQKSDRKIFGFRPPETVYDDKTIEALKNLHFSILASDNYEDRSVPQFYDNDKDLLVIPETGYDDYDILIRFKIADYHKQAERYLLDYKRVNQEGGLYILNYHSQLQCLKDNVEALRICIDKFKEYNSWITTANKVNDWWRAKNNLAASISKVFNDSLEVKFKNTGSIKVTDVALALFMGGSKLSNNLNLLEQNKILSYAFDEEKNQLEIYIDELKPFETKTIIIKTKNIQ